MFKLEYPAVPPHSYQSCKDEHESLGRSEKFLAYERAGCNRFLRSMLFYKQHGICPVCSKQLVSPDDSNNHVHHTTYNRYCGSLNPSTPLIKSFCPNKETGHIYKMTANCELCYFDHPSIASDCLESLTLVHDACHSKLHKKN